MTTTNVSDYFFAPTRRSMDTGDMAAKTFADNDSLSHRMTATNTGCSDALSPAVAMADQPGMIAMGGYGMPGSGCAVDTNTELRWGVPGAWRTKGPKQLWARPFGTTPNLGGGDPTSVDTESSLIQSALIRNRKEASTIMDKAIPHVFQPLIPMKADEFANPGNWVEGWTRGGDSTRLLPMKRSDGK